MTTAVSHRVLPGSIHRVKHPSHPLLPRKKSLLLIAGLIGLLLCLRSHFSLCLVKGESMLPSLRSGDLLLVDSFAYRRAGPERGDIVVARNQHGLIVKRVVGLPGEDVELRQGELLVNRLPVAEGYSVEPGWLSLRRGRLFDHRYALLGDNRSLPVILSVHAVVAKDQILGKVVHSLRLWPGWRSARS